MNDPRIDEAIRMLKEAGFTHEAAVRIAPEAATWLTQKVKPEVVGFAGDKLGFANPAQVTYGPTGGAKESEGKPPISLVPREFVEGAARAFAFGAKKYSAHNWRKGIAHSKLYDALQRHLTAYNEGEDLADDSKLKHLDHAAACLAMLMAGCVDHPELDDRYKEPTK